MSSDTKARVTVLENILGVPREGEQLSVCDRLDAIFAETTVNQVARETQCQLETEIALLKRAMSGLPREEEVVTKVKVLEPKPFNGARNAKDLEDFLWDMEQYFKAVRVPSQEMVTITSMYLPRDTNLWWRTRVEDDANDGKGKIDSWEALKKELKDQILPTNSA
ncbi:hypothetical protein ACB092_05G194500 [Castanea dentata]